MKLVIVESPAKAKTINKYLGSDYEVLASLRPCPRPAGQGRLGEARRRFRHDLGGRRQAPRSGSTTSPTPLKNADELILATDPDREGEAISWHVLDVLRQKKLLKRHAGQRVVFNAITKDAVTEAMQQSARIDMPLVDAYLARRALDYLVGFTLSPILWRKLPGSRSAGRVQSVALRLVCDREAEIEKFKAAGILVASTPSSPRSGKSFEARLYSVDGKKTDKLDIKTGDDAEALKNAIEAGSFNVTRRRQEADQAQSLRALHHLEPAAGRLVAPRLLAQPHHADRAAALRRRPHHLHAYRRRADGAAKASPRPAGHRQVFRRRIPAAESRASTRPRPRTPRKRTRPSARPTCSSAPNSSASTPTSHKLYGLIWRRTLASQMRSAEIERTTVDIAVNVPGRAVELRAVGSVVTFPGFLKLYGVEAKSRRATTRTKTAANCPPLAVGDKPALQAVEIEQHFTQPPPPLYRSQPDQEDGRARHRPSLDLCGDADRRSRTATMSASRARRCIPKTAAASSPPSSKASSPAMSNTASPPASKSSSTRSRPASSTRRTCCAISGRISRTPPTRSRICASPRCSTRSTKCSPAISSRPRQTAPIRARCPTCGTGQLSLKLGKFGAFIGCSNYPECQHTMQLSDAATGQTSEAAGDGILGTDPESGERSSSNPAASAPMSSWATARSQALVLPKGWDARLADA